MENPIYKLKQYCIDKAIGIRNLKTILKSKSSDDDQFYKLYNQLHFQWKPDYRAHHIAYCELRGKKREVIEVPREGNEPDERKIKGIKIEYLELFDEYRKEREVA